MTDPRATIPFDRVPEAFKHAVEHPPERPARPRPGAAVVLLRPGSGNVEAMLLRRVGTSEFVPGAWVFPSGEVDPQDASPPLLERLDGVDLGAAAARLGLAAEGRPAATTYWVAAARVAFEKSGILLARNARGRRPPCAADSAEVHALLADVREDGTRFAAALERLDLRLDGESIAYLARWITPVVEPLRHDTRFFAAAVPSGTEPVVHTLESNSAVWLTPAEALELNVRDTLPMTFPTIRVLEALLPFRTPEAVLEAYRDRAVPTILPRLVTTPRGIGMELEEIERA